MHRFILLLISAHDKQAGRPAGRRTDGAGLHKSALSWYPHLFSMPMCTCTRDSCNMYTPTPSLSLMRTLETKD